MSAWPEWCTDWWALLMTWENDLIAGYSGWIAEDYVAHLKHDLNQILGQTFVTNYGK